MQLLSYLQLVHNVPRRDFTQMLRDEVLKVNDQKVTTYQQTIAIGDIIQTRLGDGSSLKETVEELPSIKPTLILFNKPKDVVVSKKDPHNKTIYDILPDSRKDDFYYIGRLDKNSTGLLLLSNDPSLVDKYENPANKVKKKYELLIDKPLRTKHQMKMRKGIWITQGGKMVTERTEQDEADEAELLSCLTVQYRQQNDLHKINITLTEGKKRHIRRMMSACGYKVLELRRLKVGKWELGTLRSGERRQEKEIKRKVNKPGSKKMRLQAKGLDKKGRPIKKKKKSKRKKR